MKLNRLLLIDSLVKLADLVEGEPKDPFSIDTTPKSRRGATPFPRLLHFTLDPNLLMLSVMQVGILYHFFSLWYNSTCDWTPVSCTIGKHWNNGTDYDKKIYRNQDS